MDTTKVFSMLVAAYKDPLIDIIVLRGGTRSSKTWSVIQLLDYIARQTAKKNKRPRLISAVSETLPHLKRGAIRDFKNMLTGENLYDVGKWHDTDKIYSYSEKVALEFFAAADAAKVLGPARDILYINECINVSYEVFRQLQVRTTEKIILDYNPAYEFWVDTKLAPLPNVRIIDSTYLDNDMLSPSQIRAIEANRELDPEWWNVYGLGQQGSREGLVVKNWDIVDSLPPRELWKAAYIGVDFGWTAPTAVELVVLSQGEVWIDELAYGPNLDNPDIANAIKKEGYANLETICDAAEPKSIKDLQGLDINAVKSDNKEIQLGITIMNRYKKHYTARSLGTIQENRMYRYPKDDNGAYGVIPIKAHGHAKDAERYVFLNRLSNIASGYDVTVGSTGRK